MAELQGLIEHLFESTTQLGQMLWERTSTNVEEGFTNMTPKKWLRLTIFVCAYCLLRPYILKHGAKVQERQMEEQSKKDASGAEISPNDLRGQLPIPDDSEDDENEPASTTATDWGKKARRRQRRVIKQLLDAEEEKLRQLQEDEEDKDIAEFLTEE